MTRPTRWLFLAGPLAVVAMTVSGCAIFGWLAAVLSPPQKIPAQYKFPKNKRVVVLVDPIRDPVRFQTVAKPLTDRLNHQLVVHKVAGSTVPYNRVLEIRDEDLRRMSVSQVGRYVGADIVVYVRVDAFSLKDDESLPLWRGELATSVRVVNVSGERLWPKGDPDGQPVEVQFKTVDEPSATYGRELTESLCTDMADTIAKLFYEHEVPAIQPSP